MRKISILALICYALIILLIAFGISVAYLATIWSGGTIMGYLLDFVKKLYDEKGIIPFLILPVSAYLFQRRYNKLRNEAMYTGKKVNEFRFKRKNMKRVVILIVLIFLFYPLPILIMRTSTVGLSQIPYAYVGTINTVKERFPPYHLFLFSKKVDEPMVFFDVWSDPADRPSPMEMKGDIYKVTEELNLSCDITNLDPSLRYDYFDPADGTILTKNHVVIRCAGKGSKRVVFNFFEKEIATFPYVNKIERRGPEWD